MSKTNDTGKATDKKPDKTNTIKKGDFRNFIKIRGANEHNLQGIDVDIPRDKPHTYHPSFRFHVKLYQIMTTGARVNLLTFRNYLS